MQNNFSIGLMWVYLHFLDGITCNRVEVKLNIAERRSAFCFLAYSSPVLLPVFKIDRQDLSLLPFSLRMLFFPGLLSCEEIL